MVHRLLPPRWRRAALAVSLTCALVVAIVGVRYHEEYRPGRVDAVLDPALAARSPVTGAVSDAVLVLGGPLVTGLFIVALVVGALRVRWWSAAALAVVGPGLAALVTEFVLKPAIGRILDGDLAFPSGHAVRAVAVAMVCLVLLVEVGWSRRARVITAVVVGAAAVGVCWALVAQTWHYSTDTLGGVLVSVSVVLASALAIDAVAVLSQSRKPALAR